MDFLVYHPDGSITENVTDAAIGRKYDGTLRYGYPVVKTYTFLLTYTNKMIYLSEKFNISLGDRCCQKYADAPEDPLNELSAFEMGIRRFCYELNRSVYLEIGEDLLQVFLDPDICMLLEDRFPEKIVDLEQDITLTIDFVESEGVRIKMVAN